MTAQATLQSAMQAVNEGAFYYIQKPFRNDELVAILRRAAEHRKLRVENKSLKQAIRRARTARRSRVPSARASRGSTFCGSSRQSRRPIRPCSFKASREPVRKSSRATSTISPTRTEGPFLSINCGALPESLLESELFGHVKGSFTGAIRDKIGLFGAATKGTFFLDEIGETTPATQVKLLRALQHREVIPVGSTEAIPVDTRVVAATNRDLDEEIRVGNFRSDLYYRLNVIALHLPPLRQRARRHSAARRAFPPAHRRGAERAEPKRLTDAARDAMHGLHLARQRARARERARARRSSSRQATRSTSARCPSASPTARRAARVDAHAAQPDARGGRARVHHVGAPERERQQVARRRSARHRSVHAVSQARRATESRRDRRSAPRVSLRRARRSIRAPSRCRCSFPCTTSATRSTSSSIRCARRRCRKRSSASTTARPTGRRRFSTRCSRRGASTSCIASRKTAARARRFARRCR